MREGKVHEIRRCLPFKRYIKKHILGRVYYTEYKLRVFAYCWGMKDVVAIYWKLREERRSKGNFTEEIGVEQIVKMY